MPFLLKRIQVVQRKLYSSLHQKHDTQSLVYCLVCHMPLLRMWDVIKILETSFKPYSYCTILNLCPHSWTPDHNRTKDLSTYSLRVCNTTMFLLMNLEVELSMLCALVWGFRGLAWMLVSVLWLVYGITLAMLFSLQMLDLSRGQHNKKAWIKSGFLGFQTICQT